MADDSDQEKTEAPTPHRLEKAREEGQIARSREFTTFAILLGGIAGLWAMGGMLYDHLGKVMLASMGFERQHAFDAQSLLAHTAMLGERTLLVMLPLFLLLTVISLAAPIAIGGWSASLKSLQPKLSKLNPIKGLQRMLSMQALAELGKAMGKSLLIGTVAVYFIKGHVGELLALSGMSLHQALATAMKITAMGCVLMVFSLILISLFDVPYQLWTHTKKLRMTKDEIRREHKEQEGDPHVKGRIRSQQQAVARSRMMSKVPAADVIVTNPTHYAVALAYRDGEMGAPRVVAKGVDAVAARIREIGTENNVPLLRAPPLARALYYHVDLDREIPADLYTAVAEVLAWAYRIKKVQEEGGDAPETPHDLPVPAELSERVSRPKLRRRDERAE